MRNWSDVLVADEQCDLARKAKAIGHDFEDLGLLQRALTHRSAAIELGSRDNERLEFLGDAVLQVVISEWLYSERSDDAEGALTQRRSRLVSSVALERIAERMGLAPHMVLSVGEERSGGRSKRSVLANAVEAVLGAIYLDAGLEAAKRWILPYLGSLDSELVESEVSDAKNRLQERLQRDGRPLPEYRTVSRDGPDHSPSFVVECLVEGEVLGVGSGSSKREAQRRAAVEALELPRI